MLCLQPSWMSSFPSRHESKLQKAKSIDSFFTNDEDTNNEKQENFTNYSRRGSEHYSNMNPIAFLKEKRYPTFSLKSLSRKKSKYRLKKNSTDEVVISSVEEEHNCIGSVWDGAFVNPTWERCNSIDCNCDDFERKSSMDSNASNSSRKNSYKFKNIFDWVQKSGRRASLKYKSLKRKGSVARDDESKLRCPDPSLKSLYALLHDKDSIRVFHEFLLKERSEENLEFWLDVEFYKSQKSSCLEKSAKRIYDTYIATNSQFEINIDAQIRNETKENLQNPNVTTFDRAQAYIFKLMENDSYRRFCQHVDN